MNLPFQPYFEALAKEYANLKPEENVKVYGEGFLSGNGFSTQELAVLSQMQLLLQELEKAAKKFYLRASHKERERYEIIINGVIRLRKQATIAYNSSTEVPLEKSAVEFKGNNSFLRDVIRRRCNTILICFDKLCEYGKENAKLYLCDFEVGILRILTLV